MTSTAEPIMHTMPGSFTFQHDHLRTTFDDVFQPPAHSPLQTTQSSQISRSVSRSSNPHAQRKRPRLNANTSYFSRPVASRSATAASTPFSLDGSYDHITYASALESSTHSIEDSNPMSPSPLANSDYRLAGGLDTPSASLERGLDEMAQSEAEKDYRLNRYTTTNTSRTSFSTSEKLECSMGYESTQSMTGFGMSNAGKSRRKRARPTTPSTERSNSVTGWGIRSTAWALTGGLAGRVFNFCINTAFRGFGAGGGDSYQFDIGTPDMDMMDGSTRNDVFSSEYQRRNNLPGGFPRDLGGFVDDYMEDSIIKNRWAERTPTGSNSYQNIGSGDGSFLKSDWHIVEPVSCADSGDERSPVRKKSRASVAGGFRRPDSRASTTATSMKVTATGASYASPRSRSSTGLTNHRTVSSGSVNVVRRSRTSIASPRRAQSSYSGSTNVERPSSAQQFYTPGQSMSVHADNTNHGMSPEIMTYKRKIKQREKAEDENLRRLNAQLRDMIKQGKEALGSKVEILDDEDDGIVDEGFYESEWV